MSRNLRDMQIVTFSTLQMLPPPPTPNMPLFGLTVPQVVTAVGISILVWKSNEGKRGKKKNMGGYLFLITLASNLNNKAHAPHPASHVPHHKHPPPQRLPLPRASIHAQLSLSREAGRCLFVFFSSPCIKIWVMAFFGIWKRISIYQILQRLKLQRRLFDI